MSTNQANRIENPQFHWPSLIQLILSLLAAFFLFALAALLGISAAFQYFNAKASFADLTQPFLEAASLVFVGVLVLPSAWFAWRRIAFPEREPTPHPERRSSFLVLTIVVVVLEVGVLLLGNWAVQNDRLAWFLLPTLNVIATGLPALWLIYLGTRGLVPGAPRRRWGIFAAGLVLGPLTILVIELVLLFLVGFVAILWVMLNPSLANQMYALATQIQNSGPNLDGVIKAFIPFLLNPGILFLVFALLSVLAPLVEEALKPIGLWFFAGQKFTPAQGFGYGIISGAGFGLFENLGNTSTGGSGWALLVAARISSLLLHCFTAGIVGWALALAWSERRYLRLAITYAIAVGVHGLWNALALLSLGSALQAVSNSSSLPANLQQISAFATGGVVLLGVVVFLFYIGLNTSFRRKISSALFSGPGDHLVQKPSQAVFQPTITQAPGELSPGTDVTPPSAPVEGQPGSGSDPTTFDDEGKSTTNPGINE